MVHDKARVEAIRARINVQLELVKSLEAKIAKGNLDPLRLARLHTEDIESFFLKDLDRKDRTADEEARWLSSAEENLQAAAASLDHIKQQFSKFGDHGVEIVTPR